LHSPYGATEALPLVSLAGEEARALRDRPDTCLGRALPGIALDVIAVHAGTLRAWSETRRLPPGEIGELVARGPVVSRAYDGLPNATAAAKIPPETPTDGVAHRLGDAGYCDADGRWWFCGRLVERVETAQGPLYTEPVERVFRDWPGVARCALIGLGPRGAQEPALVVELKEKRSSGERARFAAELLAHAATQPATQAIRRVFFHPRFPVDVRHNAKIHRLALARWAQGRAGFGAAT
jgi:acyl-CoA synthetase (AMP-forming)/AMP-acid ligase II